MENFPKFDSGRICKEIPYILRSLLRIGTDLADCAIHNSAKTGSTVGDVYQFNREMSKVELDLTCALGAVHSLQKLGSFNPLEHKGPEV
jgi:hypothetical protein